MSAAQVLKEVLKLSRENQIRTVSLTGGEPLAHVGFLKEFLPQLKKEALKVYLETAGVHPEALQQVIDQVDVVSMDVKLPSATGKNFWSQHEKFLEIADSKAFVKIVVEKHSSDDEIDRALTFLSHRRRKPTVILQPVTSIGPTIQPPSAERLGFLYERAKALLPEVFVMPQQHKIWGIR
jgi:organic radical activating enzyme